MKFSGYRRPDGSVGIRNHLLVIPSVVCANNAAAAIANQVPGAVAITHQHGCAQLGADAEQTRRTLIGMGLNPNVAAVVVVGLGCETNEAEKLAAAIGKGGKPVGLVGIQASGGAIKAIARGVELARAMSEEISQLKPEECDLSEVTVALECGGSDTTSGVAANPAVGLVSDRLVDAGATVILSETSELIGAEHLLAARAAAPEVAARLLEFVQGMEEGTARMGVDIRGANPTPGNIAGGLSTIEEKSLGCVHKAGSREVVEAVAYAERPSRHGLVVMDTPGHDIESITGMVAGGAQLVIFTTGRGTPTGCPVAPVIKVTGNPATYANMADNIDINAGTVITGEQTLEEVAETIWQVMLACLAGRRTKAETLGFWDFAINRIGPTM